MFLFLIQQIEGSNFPMQLIHIDTQSVLHILLKRNLIFNWEKHLSLEYFERIVLHQLIVLSLILSYLYGKGMVPLKVVV